MYENIYKNLSPGPTISGHPVAVQNSEMVPYIRFTLSKIAIARN